MFTASIICAAIPVDRFCNDGVLNGGAICGSPVSQVNVCTHGPDPARKPHVTSAKSLGHKAIASTLGTTVLITFAESRVPLL